ncbi:MAG: hypothetical protein CM1200mP2_09500 [Planctomycetaceae bacterium]|nr:MAG: hypothetical protein CM1200mP2_09500 [Planctomycetaceae bacterium]
MILVGPRAKNIAGWSLNEAGFIEALVQEMQQKYRIDSRRVVLHSYSDGCRFSFHLAFKYRSLFRGVAASSEPLRLAPPENRPDLRLQFFPSCGDKEIFTGWCSGRESPCGDKIFPVVLTTVPGEGHSYPPIPVLDAIARWIDMLDRI